MPRRPLLALEGRPVDRRTKGETPLAVWLIQTDTTAYELAMRVGCDPKMIYRWRDGLALPSMVYAAKLRDATNGGVFPEAWEGTTLFQRLYAEIGADWKGMLTRKADWKRAHP